MANISRQFRPLTFADVFGQQHVKTILQNQVMNAQLAQAYLLHGPRGTGKTTLARIIARAANCTDLQGGEPCGKCDACASILDGKSLDVVEMDAASHTGVDNIRENIIETTKFTPSQWQKKVFIIDEVHMLSTAAFNALLKTLEEPPAHVMFLLLTTELHKIPETIVSRCQHFDLRRVERGQVVEKLQKIATAQKVKIDEEVLQKIALLSGGGMRDAESMLDQLLGLGEKKITLEQAAAILPLSFDQERRAFLGFLAGNDVKGAVTAIENWYQDGQDMEVFLKLWLKFLGAYLKFSIAPETVKNEVSDEDIQAFQDASWPAEQVNRCLGVFITAQERMRWEALEQIPLQMGVVEFVHGGIAKSGEDLRSGSIAVGKEKSDKSDRSIKSVKSGDKVGGEGDVQAARESASEDEERAERRSSATSASKDGERGGRRSSATSVLEPGGSVVEQISAAEPKASIKSAARVAVDVSIEKLQDVWPAFLDKVGEQYHSLLVCLQGAVPVKVEEGALEVQVRHNFHRDKLSEMKHKDNLAIVLGEVSGTEGVGIRFVVPESEEGKLISGAESKDVEEVDVEDVVGEVFGV